MKLLVIVVILLVSSVITYITFQKTPSQQQTNRGASISGQVTLHGTPVREAVILVRSSEAGFGSDPVASAKTDADGQYRIVNLTPGRYIIAVRATALTSEVEISRGVRREITLDSGETRDKIDFALVRGGVITGRVSSAKGRPIVGEMLSIDAASANSPQPFFDNHEMLTTDDRGVYRIYGVPPGHYKVSVGEGGGSHHRRLNYGQSYYPNTYHPGVQDESKAGIIEVTEGAEVTGVDIVVEERRRTYEASGRIVNAETGQAQPGIKWGYGGNAVSTFGMKSDENGRFKITGLMPGQYDVFTGCEGDFYSDKHKFEVTDHDVTGLEIRRTPGVGIRGRVDLEGEIDPEVLRNLNQVTLIAVGTAASVNARIEPDGSFYFCGLRPGRVTIRAYSISQPGFQVLRVEHNGSALREGIDVAPGNRLADVRVVLGYMTGVIRGQVNIEEDKLPPGVYLQISVRRLGNESAFNHFSEKTDDLGRFAITGLPPGEYELSAGGALVIYGPRTKIPRFSNAKQTVIVTNGRESSVTLTLKLIEK
jgi:Carboxypeptidase regulatory-like domain